MQTSRSSMCVETPLGIIQITGSETEITTIQFVDTYIQSPQHTSRLVSECAEELQKYFHGLPCNFQKFAFVAASTDFERAVRTALLCVPAGETISYGELALRSGHPGAARAVGTAMKRNPLPVIIPCHRVLPSDGTIGEYACGRERKEWLLNHEVAFRARKREEVPV